MTKKAETKFKLPAAAKVQVVTPRSYVLKAALICAMVAFAVYANTIGHDFTVDDGTVITDNSITKKGVSAIPEIFSKPYRAGFWDRDEGLYRPLSVAMYAIEWQLAPENPLPGHLINIILYSLTVFLLLLLLAEVFKDYSLLIPFAASLLFAIHPLHTEVVANIKSRDEILCLLFGILALLHFDGYIKSRNMLHIILAACCYLLALLSKENAVTLLAVVPLWAWFVSKKGLRESLISMFPFVFTFLLYMGIRYSALGSVKGSATLQLVNNSLLGLNSIPDRFFGAIQILGKYIWMHIVPHPLSFDYSYSQLVPSGASDVWAWLSLLLIGSMVAYAIKGFRQRSLVSFGILFFFITISLVSNVFFLIESTMAERFAFMPSVGFIAAMVFLLMNAAGISSAHNPNRFSEYFTQKPGFTVVLALLFLVYSGKTIARNMEWKDNFTLLSKDVKTCPNSARIRYAFGSALLMEKALKEKDEYRKQVFLDQAIVQLERGVSILPDYAEAWFHLGLAYNEKKNYNAALNAFTQARLHKEFDKADFYLSEGLALGKSGRPAGAVKDFTRAIELDSSNAESFNNKGLYLFEGGYSDSSLVFFDKAISMKPDFYQAWYNKGNTFAKAGNYTEAIRLYQIALKYDANNIDALMNSGNSYAAMRDYINAMKFFKRVEELQPENKNVLINIGITYKSMGDESLANQYFVKAGNIK